jgi:hypothetical protein
MMRVVCINEIKEKPITVYDFIPYNIMENGKPIDNHRLYIRYNKEDKEYELVKEYYFTKAPITHITIDNGRYKMINGYSNNEEEVLYRNNELRHVIAFANNITAKIWQIHALAICQHKEPFKSINCTT